MKRRIFIFCFLCLSLTFVLASCGNDDVESLQPTAPMKESPLDSKLAKALVEALDSLTKEENSYLVYNASSDTSAAADTILVMTESDYDVAVAFSYLVVKSAPSGKDWINGGTGRTKLDAISIAKRIAQKIPKRKDFEDYVDYHEDGSFTVYYRLVK